MGRTEGERIGNNDAAALSETEIQAAEEKGFANALQVVQDICESPSLFAFNVSPVESQPTIPAVLKRVVTALMPNKQPDPPPPLKLPCEYEALPRFILRRDPRQNTFFLGTYMYTQTLVKLNYSIDLQYNDYDDDSPCQLRGEVMVSSPKSPEFGATIIGHILNTGTAVLVDPKFNYYFYSPQNAQYSPWFGMRNMSFAKVTVGQYSSISLEYWDDVSIVSLDALDSQRERMEHG